VKFHVYHLIGIEPFRYFDRMHEACGKDTERRQCHVLVKIVSNWVYLGTIYRHIPHGRSRFFFFFNLKGVFVTYIHFSF
jgi:hypothetical protein